MQLFEDIKKGVEQYNAYSAKQRAKDDRYKTKHVCTWLNQRCFEDEYEYSEATVAINDNSARILSEADEFFQMLSRNKLKGAPLSTEQQKFYDNYIKNNYNRKVNQCLFLK